MVCYTTCTQAKLMRMEGRAATTAAKTLHKKWIRVLLIYIAIIPILAQRMG